MNDKHDDSRAPEPVALSRHSRAMLLNVLWHHQGGSSPSGQPIRKLLGIGQHDHLSEEQLSEAKWIDNLLTDGTDKESLTAALSVPDDWQLVPVKPTPDMLAEFWDEALSVCMMSNSDGAYQEKAEVTLREAYRAMLAVAPKPGETT